MAAGKAKKQSDNSSPKAKTAVKKGANKQSTKSSNSRDNAKMRSKSTVSKTKTAQKKEKSKSKSPSMKKAAVKTKTTVPSRAKPKTAGQSKTTSAKSKKKSTSIKKIAPKINANSSTEKKKVRSSSRNKKTKPNLEFPKTKWGTDGTISFEATEHLPQPALTSIAGGFVFHDGKVVMANIPGRGWEIIGGRIDVGETPEETFCRETYNQVGVILSHVKMIGVVKIEHTGPEPPNCPYPFPIGYGIQFIGIVDELLPFTGGADSLGRSLITPEGLKEHYYEWNDYFEAVFKYAYSVYTKWRKKLKV